MQSFVSWLAVDGLYYETGTGNEFVIQVGVKEWRTELVRWR